MKYLALLFLVFIFFSTLSYSQNKKLEYVIDQILAYDRDYTYRFTYEYDDKDSLISRYCEILNNQVWLPKTKFIFKYNNSGDVIYLRNEYYIDGKLNSSNVMEFLTKDKILNEHFWVYNNDTLEREEKKYYIYNSKLNLLKEVDSAFINGKWECSALKNYNYNNDLLINLKIEYFRDNKLTSSRLYNFSYDERGNKIHEVRKNELKNILELQVIYKYNKIDSIISMLVENYVNGDWAFFRRFEYDYDNLGNRIFYEQEYSDINGRHIERTVNKFDGKNLIEKILYRKNETWDTISKSTMEYDSRNNLFYRLEEVFKDGNFLPQFRYSAEYDTADVLLNDLLEKWDKKWIYQSRYTRAYDPVERKVTKLMENYSSSKWQNEYRVKEAYDENNLIIEVTGESWDNGYWSSALTGFIDPTQNNVPGIKIIISYKKTSDVPEENDLKLSLYPNPAEDFISIEYVPQSNTPATISLLNVEGKLIKNLISYNTKSDIPISELPPGVYFIKLTSGSETTTKKIMVIK